MPPVAVDSTLQTAELSAAGEAARSGSHGEGKLQREVGRRKRRRGSNVVGQPRGLGGDPLEHVVDEWFEDSSFPKPCPFERIQAFKAMSVMNSFVNDRFGRIQAFCEVKDLYLIYTYVKRGQGSLYMFICKLGSVWPFLA